LALVVVGVKMQILFTTSFACIKLLTKLAQQQKKECSQCKIFF